MRPRTREELETTITFNRTMQPAVLWTADSLQAKRWRKKGYAVIEDAHGWRVEVPKRMITFRRLGGQA